MFDRTVSPSPPASSSRPTPSYPTPSPRPYRPLVVVLLALATGIAVDRFAAASFVGEVSASLVGCFFWKLLSRRASDRAACAMLLVAVAAVGAAWHHACWRLFDVDDLGAFAEVVPRSIVCEGTIVDAPRIVERATEYDSAQKETLTRFTLAATAVRDGAAWRRAAGWCDVQIDARVEDLTAGDRIRLIGRISRSPPPLNPGEFDFAAHYRAERKLCVLRGAAAGAIRLVEHGTAFDPTTTAARWRRRGHEWLLAHVPSQQAGFASALLLGYRDQLDQRENLAFFRTGTVHILSISGLHIGILALFLTWSLRLGWLSDKTALAVTMLVTTIYVFVIDADPPAVRAALAVVLSACGALLARRAVDANLLAAAAIVVLAMNPTDLFRAGPQLSFLAAAVLAWSSQRRAERERLEATLPDAEAPATWRTWLRRRSDGVRQALVTSTVIFAVAAPLVAERFHILSPIALVLTPILALPVAAALLAGFLTLTLGALVPPLALYCGTACGACLAFIQGCVDLVQRVPYGYAWLPGPTVAQVAAFYSLLAAYLVALPGGRLRRLLSIAALVWGAATLVPRHTLPPDVALRTTFISVGHGLSVLVEQRDGPTWLYDCGRFGAAERGARSIAGLLWSRGITRLDGLVISHTDADHYNGFEHLLEMFRIDRTFASHVTCRSPSSAAEQIRRLARRAGSECSPLSQDDPFPMSTQSVSIRVLHPPPEGVVGNDNANSIVLLVECRGRRILLTGDVEGLGLDRILAMPPLDCDVVLAPHHGSARSNPPGLAAWSRPETVVVSGDEDRRGVVRRAYESAGAELLQTTVDGAVTVDVLHDGTLRVSSFCKPIAGARGAGSR